MSSLFEKGSLDFFLLLDGLLLDRSSFGSRGPLNYDGRSLLISDDWSSVLL